MCNASHATGIRRGLNGLDTVLKEKGGGGIAAFSWAYVDRGIWDEILSSAGFKIVASGGCGETTVFVVLNKMAYQQGPQRDPGKWCFT